MAESRYLKRARDMLLLAEAHDRWPALRAVYGPDRHDLLQYIADQLVEMRTSAGTLRDDRPSLKLIADDTGVPAAQLHDFVADLKVFGAL